MTSAHSPQRQRDLHAAFFQREAYRSVRTPRFSHVLHATPEWRRTLRLKSTGPVAKRGRFPSLSPKGK